MARIIVTGAGGPAGSSVARQLTDRGHHVIGVDMAKVADRHVSEFHCGPAATDLALVPFLRRLVETARGSRDPYGARRAPRHRGRS